MRRSKMGTFLISSLLFHFLFSFSSALLSSPDTAPTVKQDFTPCLTHYTRRPGLPVNPLPRDCRQALLIGGGVDGTYIIYPLRVGECTPHLVYCDQGADGGGWTLIQRRMDGRLDFYRGWEDYKWGFGSLHGEHWLGLETMHALTMQTEYHLFVKMYLPQSLDMGKAEYYLFFIGSEAQNYSLAVSQYDPSSNAGDSLKVHNGLPFSTWDRDNDQWNGNCAVDYKGGWWYSGCHTSNLNGLYLRPPYPFAKGVVWQTWGGFRNSLLYTEMKIRPTFL